MFTLTTTQYTLRVYSGLKRAWLAMLGLVQTWGMAWGRIRDIPERRGSRGGVERALLLQLNNGFEIPLDSRRFRMNTVNLG